MCVSTFFVCELFVALLLTFDLSVSHFFHPHFVSRLGFSKRSVIAERLQFFFICPPPFFFVCVCVEFVVFLG